MMDVVISWLCEPCDRSGCYLSCYSRWMLSFHGCVNRDMSGCYSSC